MPHCRTERPELVLRETGDGGTVETACHLYRAA
jgi:hypothetical protein